MADVSGPSVSIEENLPISDIPEPDGEPEAKKQKTEHPREKLKFKLEDRLCGILCCAVCLDLPTMAVYQVIFANCQKVFFLFANTSLHVDWSSQVDPSFTLFIALSSNSSIKIISYCEDVDN